MPKTTRFMVYSAITAEQAQRNFEADAARAEHEGYEPIAQSWDRTTLTVTYQRHGDRSAAGPYVHAVTTQGGASLGSALERRPGLAAAALMLVGVVMVGGVVLLNAPS